MPVPVPEVLRQRLGGEASLALREFVDEEQRDWRGDVLCAATDRFECRLAAEVASLRREFNDGLAGIRQELSTTRVELLKWSFIFWVGQLAAVAGLINFMVRPGH